MIITDKLRSYKVAKKKLLKRVEHRQHKGLNNQAENSHKPTRIRERRMGRFKSPQFLSAFETIRGHFHPHQHQLTATEYRETMSQRFESWEEVTHQDIAV